MYWKNQAIGRPGVAVSRVGSGPLRLFAALFLLITLCLNIAVPVGAQAAPASSTFDENWITPGSFQPGLVAVKFKANAKSADGQLQYNYSALRADKFLSSPQLSQFGISGYVQDNTLPGLYYYHVSEQADMKALVKALRADSQVQYAEPNYLRHLTKTANDPFYTGGRQYYLSKINIEGAWDVTTGSNNVVVAILDTGVRVNHVDIDRSRIIMNRAKTFLGTDQINGQFLDLIASGNGTAPVGSAGYNYKLWDPIGHGTAVAGIIGANTNNYSKDNNGVVGGGMAGINWNVLFLPIQVCGVDGCPSVGLASGITYAANNKARIINLSLGGFQRSEVEAEAIRYAENKGVVIVAAAGNELTSTPSYPASLAGVISVGATDANDKLASFSNFGAPITVVAPGVKIWTTHCNFLPNANDSNCESAADTINCNSINSNPDDPESCYVGLQDQNSTFFEFYAYVSGTSFAAPIVTGIVALMVSVRPDIPADLVQSILQQTADRVPGMVSSGKDPVYGFGRVNAARAVAQTVGDPNASSKTLLQGVVSGAVLPDVVMNLDLGDRTNTITKQVDPNTGGYRFENLSPATYYLRALVPKQNRVLGPVIINATGASGEVINVNFDFGTNSVIAGPGAIPPGQGPGRNPTPTPPQPAPPPVPLLSPNSVYFNPVGPQPSTPDRYYFTEVGHTLSGAFKRYWDRNGGLSIFGFPISEPFEETSATDGKTYTVQYFQRNRFEYHPEYAGSNNEVLLGLLGSEMTKGRDFAAGQPIANSATARYFTETRHTLTDRFYNYWRNNGGLAIFGYPISEPFMEGGYLVQYFERNRFEFHPENSGTKYEVLLGLLGIDLARSRNYLPPANPSPTIVIPEGN
jgi:subtilisin family serine protease